MATEETKADAPSMGDHCGNAGALPTIKSGGKVWGVAYPTPATITKIEMRLAECAYAEAMGLQKLIPGIVPDALSKIQMRYHRALGPWWNAAFNKPMEGQALMVWACCSDLDKAFAWEDAIQALKESRSEVKFALAIVTPPFYELIAAITPMTAAELAGAEEIE